MNTMLVIMMNSTHTYISLNSVRCETGLTLFCNSRHIHDRGEASVIIICLLMYHETTRAAYPTLGYGKITYAQINTAVVSRSC